MKLQIRNFQCHDRVDLELDSKITCIVGPSDSGKSAMLRAWRWVALNRPLGDAFVKEGESGAGVRLTTEDNRVVERRKGKRGNLYRLDGEDLASFGTEVPEPVQEAVRLSELNFQGQHDPPFWFGLSPGELARRLNDLVDLGLIDQVQSAVASDLRACRASARAHEIRVEESREEADRLSVAAELEEDLAELEEMSARLQANREKAHDLREAIKEIAENQERVDALSAICEEGARIVERLERVGARRKEQDELKELVEEWEEEWVLVDGFSAICQEGSAIVGDLERVVARRKEQDELKELVEEWEEESERFLVLRREYDRERENLREELDGRCPLCGSEVSDEFGT